MSNKEKEELQLTAKGLCRMKMTNRPRDIYVLSHAGNTRFNYQKLRHDSESEGDDVVGVDGGENGESGS